jgi:hypothetical protein
MKKYLVAWLLGKCHPGVHDSVATGSGSYLPG